MNDDKIARLAKDATAEIVRDLADRSGMGWDAIDDEIQEEILAKWTQIITTVFGAGGDA